MKWDPHNKWRELLSNNLGGVWKSIETGMSLKRTMSDFNCWPGISLYLECNHWEFRPGKGSRPFQCSLWWGEIIDLKHRYPAQMADDLTLGWHSVRWGWQTPVKEFQAFKYSSSQKIASHKGDVASSAPFAVSISNILAYIDKMMVEETNKMNDRMNVFNMSTSCNKFSSSIFHAGDGQTSHT